MASQVPNDINVQVSTGAHQKAFVETKAARDALAPEKVTGVYTDILGAGSKASAAVAQSAPYEEQLSRLPGCAGIRALLAQYALAAAQAQYEYEGATPPIEELAPMIEELRAKRDVLMLDAKTLIARGYMKADQIVEVTMGNGYRVICYDVIRLCNRLQAALPEIAGRTAVTMAEIEAAIALAEKAEALVALKETNEKKRVVANEVRQRAFTLFDGAHAQLRRGLRFILDDEDAVNAIAPALAARRGKGRAAEEEVDADAAVPATANGNGNGAVAPIVAPIHAPASPNGGAVAPIAAIPPGMPGASPFMK